MNRAAPLGPLAYAVLEQHEELAMAAIARAIRARRTAKGCAGGHDCPVTGHLFGEQELARQHLQPGNWLAVGFVNDPEGQSVIEINLTTRDGRERPVGHRGAEWPVLATSIGRLDATRSRGSDLSDLA